MIDFIEACKRVNGMSDSELEKTLSEAKTLEGVDKKAEDICYTHWRCVLLQIPYSDVDGKSMLRARAAAYYVLHGEDDDSVRCVQKS
jgi:hypothetical protein